VRVSIPPTLVLSAAETLARIQRDEVALPSGAEGYFAIPRWQNLAGTYNEAIEKVLAKLASTRPFYNYREAMTGPHRSEQDERVSLT
jgi:hypothetical protein